MDKIILYCCLLCYSIIMSETSAQETTGCNVSIEQSKHADIPPVILESEQSYYSNTNGKSFRRVPKFVGSIQLNASIASGSFRFEVSRLRTHMVTFAYNGTHICSSAQLRLETDTCLSGSSPGCYNKTNACDSVCFLSTDFYKRHSLKLFRSESSSFDIGTWEEHDDASLYTMPNKQITCFHGNESYKNWDYSDSTASYPNLEKVHCSMGQRCRISTGKVMYSDPITTYVGCERDENQFDGCDGGCSVLAYHRAPGGGSSRWVRMCKYCCTENLCNNPYKCKGTECDLNTEHPGHNDGNVIFKTYYTLMSTLLILVSLMTLV